MFNKETKKAMRVTKVLILIYPKLYPIWNDINRMLSNNYPIESIQKIIKGKYGDNI